MKRWLTKTERKTLKPKAKKALRWKRRVAHWGPTGNPPWVKSALGALQQLAIAMVKLAANAALDSGEARAQFALDGFMEVNVAATHVSAAAASGLIQQAFDGLRDAGKL